MLIYRYFETAHPFAKTLRVEPLQVFSSHQNELAVKQLTQDFRRGAIHLQYEEPE